MWAFYNLTKSFWLSLSPDSTTWNSGVKLQPGKPHLSSVEVKVEGKNGWLAPTQAMSTQQFSIQYSFTQLPLVTSLHTEFTALCFLLLALMMGEFDFKKKKRIKHESRSFVSTCRKLVYISLCMQLRFAEQIWICRRNNVHRIYRVTTLS